jgi:FkbM family methyltransferase
MLQVVNNFTVFESIYGRFVVNRHCAFQAEALAKTGRPHIEAELRNILAVVNVLPDGAVCVDAGANIGLVAIPIAQALKPRGGRVAAFEVQRMLFYALCGAAALNDLDNLFAYHAGLGGVERQAAFDPPDYSIAQDYGTLSLARGKGEGAEIVDIVPIDNLGLSRVDFLKIDVEGMEPEVIAGARQTILKHRPWCWVEYFVLGLDKVKEAFAPFPDYEFRVMDELNVLCAPREKLQASGLFSNPA